MAPRPMEYLKESRFAGFQALAYEGTQDVLGVSRCELENSCETYVQEKPPALGLANSETIRHCCESTCNVSPAA